MQELGSLINCQLPQIA